MASMALLLPLASRTALGPRLAPALVPTCRLWIPPRCRRDIRFASSTKRYEHPRPHVARRPPPPIDIQHAGVCSNELTTLCRFPRSPPHHRRHPSPSCRVGTPSWPRPELSKRHDSPRSNRRRPISTPFPSTPPRRRAFWEGGLHRCTARPERRGLGPMTR